MQPAAKGQPRANSRRLGAKENAVRMRGTKAADDGDEDDDGDVDGVGADDDEDGNDDDVAAEEDGEEEADEEDGMGVSRGRKAPPNTGRPTYKGDVEEEEEEADDAAPALKVRAGGWRCLPSAVLIVESKGRGGAVAARGQKSKPAVAAATTQPSRVLKSKQPSGVAAGESDADVMRRLRHENKRLFIKVWNALKWKGIVMVNVKPGPARAAERVASVAAAFPAVWRDRIVRAEWRQVFRVVCREGERCASFQERRRLAQCERRKGGV
jgi:hypothetical protein